MRFLFYRFQISLPIKLLESIYEFLIRACSNYGDVIYDKPFDKSLNRRSETIPQKVALATSGAIRGSSRENQIQQKLDLEALCLYLKINKNKCPCSYSNYCPKVVDFYKRSSVLIYRFSVLNITSLYVETLFLSPLIERNNLDSLILISKILTF